MESTWPTGRQMPTNFLFPPVRFGVKSEKFSRRLPMHEVIEKIIELTDCNPKRKHAARQLRVPAQAAALPMILPETSS